MTDIFLKTFEESDLLKKIKIMYVEVQIKLLVNLYEELYEMGEYNAARIITEKIEITKQKFELL